MRSVKMGNRIIKETIRTSKHINALNDFQFRLWTYLLTYVDDYGRGSADTEILKGFVFPRRKDVREQDIDKGLDALERNGSILLYKVAGEPYFCFPTWGEHQRIQTKQSKFPAPSEQDMQRWDSQNHRDSRCVTVTNGESPPESKIESESEVESKSKYIRSEDFDAFWSSYPKKVGKEAARKAFAKVKVGIDVLISAIDQQKRSTQWQKDDGQYIPNPATWLNQGRWEDILPEGKSVPQGASGRLGEAELEAIQRVLRDRSF